jgi:hypothetical protein
VSSSLISKRQRHVRAQIGRATADGDFERATEKRREYKSLKLEQHIRELVDTWPPLTTEQRDQLAAILRPAPSTLGEAET